MIPPKVTTLTNSIEIHKIRKFFKNSTPSEKYKARAGDFIEFVKISKFHQIQKNRKFHKVSLKFEKHMAGADDFTVT